MAIIIYILSLCAAVTLSVLLAKPIKFIVKIMISSIVGCILILLINSITPLCIGVNPATAAICGFLGIPGVILIVLFELFV